MLNSGWFSRKSLGSLGTGFSRKTSHIQEFRWLYKKSVEGFGITYIEAASYGKPSIGGIYGGEGDAIKSGQTGYLCNGNDLNAIYDTLLKTLANDHYLKLGANALEFSKDFNWEKIIKKYIRLI